MESKEYTFHAIDIRYSSGFFISLFGGLLLIVGMIVIFLLNNKGDSIYILYLSALIIADALSSAAYFALRYTKANKIFAVPETVSVEQVCLKSKHFGDVYYQDITDYKIFKPLINWFMPPMLEMSLHNGEVIRYYLKLVEDSTESEEYIAFLAAFVKAVNLYKQKTNRSKVPVSINRSQNQQPALQERCIHQNRMHAEAKEAVARANKDIKKSKVVISISFIVAVVLFFDVYGEKTISYYKNKPLRDMFAKAKEREKQLPLLLSNEVAKEGALYLYTNDKDATIRLAADIGSVEVEGIDAFNSLAADNSAMQFLHDEKNRHFTVVINDAEGKILKKPLVNTLASDSKEKTIHILLSTKSTENRPASSSVGVTIKLTYEEVSELGEQLQKHLPGDAPAVLATQPWYLFALERENVTATDFKQAAKHIIELLDFGTDFSAAFQYHENNGNGDPVSTAPVEIDDIETKKLQELIEIRNRIKQSSGSETN